MSPEEPTSHLTADLVARWRARGLNASEILTVSDHLASCDECRETWGASGAVSTLAAGLRRLVESEGTGPPHVTAEDLGGWVDGSLDATAVERVRAHLTSCEPCRLDAEDLAGFAAARPGADRWRRSAPWLVLAASLAAVLGAGWLAQDRERAAAVPPSPRELADPRP
jgi:hypothetical protein